MVIIEYVERVAIEGGELFFSYANDSNLVAVTMPVPVDRGVVDVVFVLILLFFAIAVAVHIGQLLEARSPAIQVVKVLLVVLCSYDKTVTAIKWPFPLLNKIK